MGTETATIRVSRATRDAFADLARERGMSVAALLAELAREQEVEAIWQSEREANRMDAENPDVAAEETEWESAMSDGVG